MKLFAHPPLPTGQSWRRGTGPRTAASSIPSPHLQTEAASSSAWCHSKCPSNSHSAASSSGPLEDLVALQRGRIFFRVAFSWAIEGEYCYCDSHCIIFTPKPKHICIFFFNLGKPTKKKADWLLSHCQYMSYELFWFVTFSVMSTPENREL